jgi:hypothetical protein
MLSKPDQESFLYHEGILASQIPLDKHVGVSTASTLPELVVDHDSHCYLTLFARMATARDDPYKVLAKNLLFDVGEHGSRVIPRLVKVFCDPV